MHRITIGISALFLVASAAACEKSSSRQDMIPPASEQRVQPAEPQGGQGGGPSTGESQGGAQPQGTTTPENPAHSTASDPEGTGGSSAGGGAGTGGQGGGDDPNLGHSSASDPKGTGGSNAADDVVKAPEEHSIGGGSRPLAGKDAGATTK